MKIYKTISVLLLVMAMGCGVAQAQIVTTPYSKMAYGMLNDNVSSIQRSMGGVGYAMRGGRIVNVMIRILCRRRFAHLLVGCRHRPVQLVE